MIPRLWTCKELALIAAIVALACIAAFLSIKLTRPKPFASATLGVESQGKPQAVDHELAQDCSHQAGQFAGKAELVAPGVAGVRFLLSSLKSSAPSARLRNDTNCPDLTDL